MLVVVMKRLPSTEYLSVHLKRQLIFLRNSVAAYDNGCVEEAIRIGVVIRVLCHDTQQSESLLQKMGQKVTLRFVTTAKTVFNDIVNIVKLIDTRLLLSRAMQSLELDRFDPAIV